MSWQVGDLAVCVGGNPWFNPDASLSADRDPGRGAVCLVTGLDWADGRLGLWLDGYPSDSYDASEFRKVIPDQHEDCEPEFITLLENIKRKEPAEQTALAVSK